MSGDQKGDDLVADVLRVQALPGVFVSSVEHAAEQVVGVVVPRFEALAHNVVHHLVHQSDVALVLLAACAFERVHDRQGRRQTLRVVQRSAHGFDKGMRGLSLERFQVETETAQTDGVEGQPRHVLRYLYY